MAGKKLTPKQAAFVAEYLVDLNATQAAIRAGYSAKTAGSVGAENLSKPEIAAAIAEAQQKRAERTEITQDKVLARYWQIATANANELVQFRRVCCRHCHGKGHGYQWRDEAEFADAVLAAQEGQPKPTDEGGYGYDKRMRPNAKCPRCYGEGYGEIFAADTRDVTGDALVLYAGVKQTQGGFEVKMHDQLAALQSVARHLGMFNDKIGVALNGSVSVTHELSPAIASRIDWLLNAETPE